MAYMPRLFLQRAHVSDHSFNLRGRELVAVSRHFTLTLRRRGDEIGGRGLEESRRFKGDGSHRFSRGSAS